MVRGSIESEWQREEEEKERGTRFANHKMSD